MRNFVKRAKIGEYLTSGELSGFEPTGALNTRVKKCRMAATLL